MAALERDDTSTLGTLLLVLAVKQHGEVDWDGIADALRAPAERLGAKARTADECRAAFAAPKA